MKRKEKNHKKILLARVIILMYSNKCKCTYYVKTIIGELSNIQCMYGKVKRTLCPSIDLNNLINPIKNTIHISNILFHI